MAKNDKYSRGFHQNTFETVGEVEESGSSGRIDTEITVSEDSSAPTRKFIDLNSSKQDSFGVPIQPVSASHLSSQERKELIRRLRLELELIQTLKKKVELHHLNVPVSSSSDILSCSNGTNGALAPDLRKSSVITSGPGKKANPTVKGRWNKSSSRKQVAPSSTNVMLMKQCEALLNRLMSHQHAWVFNTPVDIVKWNIPDYFSIIKNPMDLGTIKTKIRSGAYSSPLEFLDDVRLTFANAKQYNPPGHQVYSMADTLSKFFEVRWKNVEKKLPKADAQDLPAKLEQHEELEIAEASPTKKRRLTALQQEVMPEPVKRTMTSKEKNRLGLELESLMGEGEMPERLIDFLKKHFSSGMDAGEEEIVIDMDVQSDETLFTLRNILDEYLLEKQNNQTRGEPCEIELLNDSGPSNSSMPQHKGNDPADEDVDIGVNEPPVSSYPNVEIKKDLEHETNKCPSPSSSSDSDSDSDSDSSSSSESDSDGDAKALSPVNASKLPEMIDSGALLDDKTGAGDHMERNSSINGLDRLEQTSQQEDGDSVPIEQQLSPEKLPRSALVIKRFADTIFKARETKLLQGDMSNPEKLQRAREELELQKQKEKAKLEAEAKVAENARRRAEASAAAEEKKKRELEREAARQALLKMEKTVDINENSQLLEDLEMLRTAPLEHHIPSSVDETSPDHSQDGLGGFKFGGSNPLEQLGLFMKEDEDEEEGEPLTVSNPPNDVEEGEID